MGYTDPGDYLRFNNINLTGITSVTARTSGPDNSRFELHVDSPTGPLVATVPVSASGDWEVYKTQEPAAVTDPGGTHDLYVVFPQTGMDLDEFTFNGPGANGNASPVISSATATPTSGAAPLKVDFAADATDPEGTAVSYEWNFGVTGVPNATGKTVSYTYTQRGIYTATLTVKDADGRAATRTFSVEVLGTCPGTDKFTGNALDRTVWPTIVREDAANYKVADGVLTINAVAGDMWTGATTAKNIISRPTPAGPWSVTTKVNMAQVRTGEQAALILRQSDQDFVKAAFIRTAEGRNVELVGLRTGAEPVVERSAIFASNAPNTVFLRMISNGTTVTAQFSQDAVNWTTVGTPRPLDRMPNPTIGISAYNGTATTPANFEWFNLSGPTDEFDGDAINDCRWTTILRPVAGETRVTGGQLQIDALDGDQYNGTSTAKNVLLQPAPATGAWQATTKVTVPQGGSYEQGGLILFKDDKNFAKAVVMDLEGTGWVVEFGQDINGVANSPTGYRSATLPASVATNGVWLRMASDGTSLRAAYSLDGATWVDMVPVRSLATLANPKIGVAGYHGNGQPISFDRFELTTGAANTAPAIGSLTATPTSGPAPLASQFAVVATDAENDPLTYQWDLNGDGTVDSTVANPAYTYTTAGDYTVKVTVSDGKLETSRTVLVTVTGAATSTESGVQGSVPSVLAVTLGAPASFGVFVPALTKDYTASTTATVTSTGVNSVLTVADRGSTHTGHLVNGTRPMPQPLQVKTGAAAYAPLTSPVALLTFPDPVSRSTAAIDFKQSIAETDGLQSGSYAKTVVFTLSTSQP
jgi:PKD repeat protein